MHDNISLAHTGEIIDKFQIKLSRFLYENLNGDTRQERKDENVCKQYSKRIHAHYVGKRNEI